MHGRIPGRWVGLTGLLAALLVAPAASLDELRQQAQAAFQNQRRDEAIALAGQMIAQAPDDPNGYFLRARMYELQGRRPEAQADYDTLLERAPHAREVFFHRAVNAFMLGRVQESVADFDRFLEAQPDREPYLWQRGIALYYAGRYEAGRRQFELHQTVNPRDVENSVWHYLCVAKLSGLAEARAKLLPVTGDLRVGMPEVLDLFAGKGSPQQVLEVAGAGNVPAEARRGQLLYAHLYLALYHEAAGRREESRRELQRAVDLNLPGNYMWEVARVHLDLLDAGRLE